MNKNTRFNPLPYSRDDSMNHMEYEVQHEENHMIQSLGKHKHTKSQKIEIKSGKGERGRKRDLLKDVICTKKSFDTSQEQITREFTTCHPSSFPLI